MVKGVFFMGEVPLGFSGREGTLRDLIRRETVYPYRGTSLIRKRLPVGPCSSPMPRALWWSYRGVVFL